VRFVSGSDYQVSPAALGAAAAGVEAVVEPGAGLGVAALGPVPGDVGHAGLSSGFLVFCDRWEWGVREAVGRGADLASDLRAAAGSYGLVDSGGEELLARLVYDVVGDPAEVGDTWADVAAAALPDREMPGWGELGAEWADTARDLADHTWPALIARALAGENPFAGQLDDLRPIVE
jgi:hypothetical protein